MAANPQSSQLPWSYVALVALPIAAFLASEFLIAWLGQLPDDSAKEAAKLTSEKASVLLESRRTGGLPIWTEAGARMQLLAMMSLFFLFAVVVILKFGSDLWLLFQGETRLKLLVAYGAGLAAGAVVLLLVFGRLPHAIESLRLPRTTDFLGTALFAKALTAAAAYGRRPWGESVFKSLLYVTNGFTALAVPAFIAGGISCLAIFEQSAKKQNWFYQIDRLKTYLYMSAGLLVLGVLYFKAWTGYPAFIILDETKAKAFVSAVNAYTMYIGIEYSIILAAYALPVAWVLSRSADRIAAEKVAGPDQASVSPVEVHQIRKDEQLVFSVKDSIQVVVALLAPFITGALPSLTAALG